MCWKQEWAAAIGNLEHAIVHIERAKVKLERRLARNRVHLELLSRSSKRNYPAMLASVQALIEKNRAGIEECRRVIAELMARQDQLFGMIKVYGINHSENPQRVKQLMGKYVPKEAESCAT
jgi:hypothetical protein